MFQKLFSLFKKSKEDNWWQDFVCTLCNKKLTYKPYSYCGHCERTLCKSCGYVPGGCGWCGG